MNLRAIVLALIQPKMKVFRILVTYQSYIMEEAMNLRAIVLALIQPKMKVSQILVTYQSYHGGGNESSCLCFGTNSTQDEGFSNTCDILELSLNRSIKGQEPIAPPNLAKMQLEINKLG